jgi:hypothetical protein
VRESEFSGDSTLRHSGEGRNPEKPLPQQRACLQGNGNYAGRVLDHLYAGCFSVLSLLDSGFAGMTRGEGCGNDERVGLRE